MKYNTTLRKLEELKIDCLLLPVVDGNKLCTQGKALDDQLEKHISKQIKEFGISVKPGNATLLTIAADSIKRVILVGLETTKNLTTQSLWKSLLAAAKLPKGSNIKSLHVVLNGGVLNDEQATQATQLFIQALAEAQYNFDTYKSEKSESSTLKQITFVCDKTQQTACKKAIQYGSATVTGINTCKNLGNQPGNVCTPSFLASEAKKLAKSSELITTKILDEKDMEKLNMGAFLSVSKGSTEPGKLIIMEYKGGDKKDAPHILVGKGITFDSGGISLKPGLQMDEMKYDMCGAASVMGIMTALTELKPKLNVIGVIASAENMPAGNASKPGDIVTTASGQTVEILNTDAEGRLVLCDALTYVERFKPASVVDIATLTGACIIALGHSTSAVMSNDDALANELLSAGEAVNDRAWQLPIWDEYQKQLDSPFADMQNIGGKGAGSITAACFLARFTKAYKWAHMDIAGTAWVSGGPEKGATGRPVPLLLQYLINKTQ